MRLLKIVLFLFLLSLLGSGAYAQNTGFELLTTGPNSEALGLNEATTAYLLGASNIYTNPANLAFETSSSFNADYSLWIGDLTNTHAAVHFKRDKGSIAFGLLASEADDFELRNRPGPSQGSFSVSYLSLAGAYAYSYKNLAIGATLQFLREELYIYDASGYAINAGLSSHWFERKLLVSATIQNLGEMELLNNDRTQLPTLLRGGLNANIFAVGSEDLNFPLSVSLFTDVVFPLNDDSVNDPNDSVSPDDVYLNVGLSVEAANIITVRGGYKSGESARPFSFGLGVVFNNITANYSLVPFETGFGTVHSIGIGYRF